MADSRLDWVVEAVHAQVRALEDRAGRRAVAVGVRVPVGLGVAVARELERRMPGVELEVGEQPGAPRVLDVSFAIGEVG